MASHHKLGSGRINRGVQSQQERLGLGGMGPNPVWELRDKIVTNSRLVMLHKIWSERIARGV